MKRQHNYDNSSTPPRLAYAAGPQQVAETLDSIVQPRFQQNAGRFGPDRVVHIVGHGRVEWIDPSTPAEPLQDNFKP